MLHGNQVGYGEMSAQIGKAERCRPDYESMIGNLKKRVQKTRDFKDAALKYFEGKSASG